MDLNFLFIICFTYRGGVFFFLKRGQLAGSEHKVNSKSPKIFLHLRCLKVHANRDHTDKSLQENF